MAMEHVSENKPIRRARLLRITLVRYVAVAILLAALLFVSAGSLSYWNAWLYMGALLFPMMFALVYLIARDPALLDKRMRIREKEEKQKKYVKVSLVFFVLSFCIPGLDYRFGWSSVPVWLVALATVLMLGGYVMFMVVMVQNTYASRIIEIQENQKLIDTGLYSIVRHPMYLAACILYIASPLVLGSFYGMVPMLFLPFLLAYRIRNEEEVLKAGLLGYEEYIRRVKFRMIPYLW